MTGMSAALTGEDGLGGEGDCAGSSCFGCSSSSSSGSSLSAVLVGLLTGAA